MGSCNDAALKPPPQKAPLPLVRWTRPPFRPPGTLKPPLLRVTPKASSPRESRRQRAKNVGRDLPCYRSVPYHAPIRRRSGPERRPLLGTQIQENAPRCRALWLQEIPRTLHGRPVCSRHVPRSQLPFKRLIEGAPAAHQARSQDQPRGRLPRSQTP